MSLRTLAIALLILAVAFAPVLVQSEEVFEKDDENWEGGEVEGDDVMDGEDDGEGDENWEGGEVEGDDVMDGEDDGEGNDDGGGEEEEEEEPPPELPDIPENLCYRKSERPIHDIERYLSYEAPLASGGKLVVLDRLFTKSQVDVLKGMFSHTATTWIYHGFDPSENEVSKFAPGNNAPWTMMISAPGFSATDLWGHIRSIAEKAFPGEGELHLASMTGYVLRWGDQLTPDLGDPNDTSLVVHLYLDKWRRNYYGETLLFNDSSSSAVAAGIHPRLGRMAVFSASARRLLHPPAVDYQSVQHLFEFRLSRSYDKFYDGYFSRDQLFSMESERRRSDTQKKFFTENLGRQAEQQDEQDERKVEDYLSRSYVAKNGRRMAVFDGFLNENDVQRLRYHIMRSTAYQYQQPKEAASNVKWIGGIECLYFRESRLHDELQKIVNFFTATNTYRPYDVSYNLVRAADRTWIDQDCGKDEHDVTLHIYLNTNWTRNLYGETAFFESTDGGGVESTAAVRPKFGRVLVFDGSFLHSARTPSPEFQGARYTFTVKYAASKELANKKAADVEGSIQQLESILHTKEFKHVFDSMRTDLEHIGVGVAKDLLVSRLNSLEKRYKAKEKLDMAEVKQLLEDVDELGREVVFDRL